MKIFLKNKNIIQEHNQKCSKWVRKKFFFLNLYQHTLANFFSKFSDKF